MVLVLKTKQLKSIETARRPTDALHFVTKPYSSNTKIETFSNDANTESQRLGVPLKFFDAGHRTLESLVHENASRRNSTTSDRSEPGARSANFSGDSVARTLSDRDPFDNQEKSSEYQDGEPTTQHF